MNSKYQTIKYKGNTSSSVNDLVSIEEPLEMTVRYKKKNKWINDSISITMRTPKNDEDLITGLLFCEGIIGKKSEIKKIEFLGDKVGKLKIQNKIQITLNNGENLDIKHLRRNFLTNSSCGVCGKTSMDSLEIICKTKVNKDNPKIKSSLITKIPDLLMENQSEFSKTGGIHASALFNIDGKPLVIRELAILGLSLFILVLQIISKESIDVFPQTPQLEFVKKFRLRCLISRFSPLFKVI